MRIQDDSTECEMYYSTPPLGHLLHATVQNRNYLAIQSVLNINHIDSISCHKYCEQVIIFGRIEEL